MNSAMKAIIALVIVAVVAGGAVLIVHNRQGTSSNANSSSTSQSSSSTESAAATITYDGSSFSPNSVTVKAGDTIKITNSSQAALSFNSNPHPVHTDEPELNVGTVDAGQSETFTVTKKGTWGYHNHLAPSQGGSIVVN
jgi:plastocyanin